MIHCFHRQSDYTISAANNILPCNNVYFKTLSECFSTIYLILFSAVETVHPATMAYPSVISRSSGRTLLDHFQSFLERLSWEIEEEQLDSLKFLLQNHISAGTLDECKTARKLLKCMKQKGLLGYNNLDFLQKLLTDAQRLDLVELVKDFQLHSTMEIDSGYPGNYGIDKDFPID